MDRNNIIYKKHILYHTKFNILFSSKNDIKESKRKLERENILHTYKEYFPTLILKRTVQKKREEMFYMNNHQKNAYRQ